MIYEINKEIKFAVSDVEALPKPIFKNQKNFI